MDLGEEVDWVALGIAVVVKLEEAEAEAAAAVEEAVASVARSTKRKQPHDSDDQQGIPPSFNLADVDFDPGTRKQIEEYATPEIRDKMRRAYLSKVVGCLYGHDFPRTHFGKDWRNFKEAWYKDYDFLEYSKETKSAYCFHSFLFKPPSIGEKFGHDVFTKKGFKNWKKAMEIFNAHVGGPNSAHNNARRRCEDFKNQKQSVSYAITCHVEKSHVEYEERLTAVVGVVRFLVSQGLAFRGHDETTTSMNRGNFLEMLDWYAERCKDVADVVHKNVPGNHQLTCHKIQKQLVQACAGVTIRLVICQDYKVGDSKFSLLVDESHDVSVREQMAVIIRFTNQKGESLERLLGVEHVLDTTSASLKRSLDAMFVKHNLSMSRLRGQGYDGASNMRGELNGLKKLVLDVNPYAFYVHCFAHQLQLVVVAIVKGVLAVSDFFGHTNKIVNMVSASCKRKDALTS